MRMAGFSQERGGARLRGGAGSARCFRLRAAPWKARGNGLTHSLALVLVLAAFSAARADEGESPPIAREAVARQLSPAKLNAVRAVGRNLLAAKKSDADDAGDAVRLMQLRNNVERLLAAELALDARTPITVQGSASKPPSESRTAALRSRDTARGDARGLVQQLRQRAGVLGASSEGRGAEATSAGFPIGAQRARLFRRWADVLDAALAADATDRTRALAELRRQLRGRLGDLSDAPLAHGTPTLQAMPAGSAVPED
jgi:hypothetical protein